MGNIFRKWSSFFEQAHASMSLYINKPSIMLNALATSVLFHFTGIVFFYLLSVSLGLGIPFRYFLLFVPLTNIVLLAPVSLNGVGVKEGMFVLLFSQVGVGSAEALSLSLLSYALVLIQAIIGAFFYARSEA